MARGTCAIVVGRGEKYSGWAAAHDVKGGSWKHAAGVRLRAWNAYSNTGTPEQESKRCQQACWRERAWRAKNGSRALYRRRYLLQLKFAGRLLFDPSGTQVACDFCRFYFHLGTLMIGCMATWGCCVAKMRMHDLAFSVQMVLPSFSLCGSGPSASERTKLVS